MTLSTKHRYPQLLVAALLTILAVPSALAQDQDEEQPEDQPDERPLTHGQVTFGAGYLSSFMPVAGAEVSFELLPHFYLGGGAYSGVQFSLPKANGDDLGSKTSTQTSLSQVEGKARYFLGNSFNLAAGLGERSATATSTIHNSEGTKSRSYTGSALLATFGLGNQWQLSRRWLLAVDYATVEVPLLSRHSSSGSTETPGVEGSTDSGRNTSLRNREKALVEQRQVTLGLLSLGIKF